MKNRPTAEGGLSEDPWIWFEMRKAIFMLVTALLLAMQVGAAAGDDRNENNRLQWQSMPPEEKRRVIENYREWKSRSPESRERIQRNFDTYRELTPAERQRLRERYRTYRNLEPDQKERLKERLHGVAPKSAGNSQDMTRRFRRSQDMPAEERMRRLERSSFWRGLSKEERETYKKLIEPKR